MTAVATPTQSQDLWRTMPGWGIVANLLPPEVVSARRMRVKRRLVLLILSLVVVVCAAGFGYAYWQSRSAASSLEAERAQASQLQVEQHKYAAVTEIQGSIGQVQTQLKGLMTADINVSKLLGDISAKLPAGMALGQIAVTLNAGSSQNTAAQPPSGGEILDISGHNHIGSITLSGSAGRLSDLSDFVDRLATVPGVAEPYPLSNRTAQSGIQFTVQLSLTDQLFNHRYDDTGSK